MAGQYGVQVLNLAKAHKLVSTANFASSTDTVGAGTLNISSGGSSFQVTTTATTTLAELEGLINSATGNPGITASLIVVAADPLDAGAGTVTRLVLNGTGTGAANTMGISVNDSDGNHTDNQGLSRFYFSATDLPGSQLAQQQAALDARIAVDGFTAFSSTNSFSGVIAGVTITAQREPTDPLAPELAQLTVAQDRARDGDDPSNVRRAQGRTTFDPITLSRGVTHDTEFESWANRVWRLGGGPGNEATLRDSRKDIVIELCNEAGQVVLAYIVRRAWVSDYQALPALDANGAEVAVESITLQHEGWERDTNVTEPVEP